MLGPATQLKLAVKSVPGGLQTRNYLMSTNYLTTAPETCLFSPIQIKTSQNLSLNR